MSDGLGGSDAKVEDESLRGGCPTKLEVGKDRRKLAAVILDLNPNDKKKKNCNFIHHLIVTANNRVSYICTLLLLRFLTINALYSSSPPLSPSPFPSPQTLSPSPLPQLPSPYPSHPPYLAPSSPSPSPPPSLQTASAIAIVQNKPPITPASESTCFRDDWYAPVLSIPSTSPSDMVRSTFFAASMTVSIGPFSRRGAVEKRRVAVATWRD